MVQTRNEKENLSTEELIKQLISVKDISSRLFNFTTRFDDFLRRYKFLSSELTVTTDCNRLLSERIVQL